MYAIPEKKVGPDANLAPCQTHIGGGADKLKFITMRSLSHVFDRWYLFIVIAWQIAVIVELVYVLAAVQP